MGNEYKIKKTLGEGGFGIVYLVEKDNKLYALKQYKMKLKNEEIKQIKELINILSTINNEYLIKYYNTFMVNDTLNILMEFAGNKDLKKFINEYKNKSEFIDEKIIRNIILQICKGLKEIHYHKLIHRDLTPDNIFINKNNQIKIGDFGISKALTSSHNYAKTRLGKSHYLAPEIERGIEYNNKVDIYSLGCILYELFTLNEYYIDKYIEEKDCKINIEIYDSKYQELIDLLLKKDYHERPDINEVIDYLVDNNCIIAEINIEEEDLNKEIRIINSYEEVIREDLYFGISNKDFVKFENEKEIKDNCKIKINDNYIDFNYFFKFKEKGQHIIKYKFTNNITKIDFMFSFCKSLTDIDLSNFNNQNVEDMSYMFYGCDSLTNINLYNFNTQNVKNMSYMFFFCKSLTDIDLSNFNTQNVKDTSWMFYKCESLVNINLSNFNTQNVENMSCMFSFCESLKNLNLSDFCTKKVKNMISIFYLCKSLINIDLSSFNTQNVENMNRMFYGCKSLINLDLSNFNTQNVKNMSYMFFFCKSITYLNLSNFDTQNVNDMRSMFWGCESLKNIDLSNFNTQNVKNMSKMFFVCKSLAILDLSIFNTQNVKNMSYMFFGCKTLIFIDLSSFVTKNVIMTDIFNGCNSLKKKFVITKDKNILEEF